MPKFDMLKNGVNEAVLASTEKTVDKYLNEMFDAEEIIKIDNLYSVSFGETSINVDVRPWHSEDVMVEVFSYVDDEVNLSKEDMENLLRLNATISFGNFGLSLEDSVKFSYSLAGKNLDMNEFSAAVQNVAAVADQYKERFAEASE